MAAPTLAKSLNLAVSNFGPIIEADIDLRPLTVFAGPSNTGKSYMATLIYVLQRFFSGGYAVEGPIESFMLSDLKPSGIPDRLDVPKNAREDMAVWLERAERVYDPGPFPKSVESLVLQSLDISKSHGRAFISEMLRCFYEDDLKRMVRRGSGAEAKIAVKSSVAEDSGAAASLEHEIAIAGNGASVFSSSTPKTIPLGIAGLAAIPYIQNSGWIQSPPNAPAEYSHAEYRALSLLATAVSDEFIAPLNGLVHYIPAGRMNIVRVHQAAGSPSANSGVIADFLQNFAGLDNPAKLRTSRTTNGLVFDLPRHSPQNPNIRKVADQIEKNILAGAVQIAGSPTGYPEFHYRPSGW